MTSREAIFFSSLQAAGMPAVPEQFSVVSFPQTIPPHLWAELTSFIRTFERVTSRTVWQETVTAPCPSIARVPRPEVCFFSAWDFHLPSQLTSNWQLIEFNDNGSGLLFAGLINAIYYELAPESERNELEPPLPFPLLIDWVANLLETEARTFFGAFPQGLFLLLDDAESLTRGKFASELRLMGDYWRQRGWPVAIASPAETTWDGQRLLFQGQPVSVVVNRSTDFFWHSELFSPLHKAYLAGTVYVAPNPFTYATRSDKRLLEFLSLPDWDWQLGIEPQERILLNAQGYFILDLDNEFTRFQL